MCPPGVGAAVDSFSLNKVFFQSAGEERGGGTEGGVPVIGAIFNRLPDKGYYSLTECRKAVTDYFEQYEKGRAVAFGFVPEVTALAGLRETAITKEELGKSLTAVDDFGRIFREYVDVIGIFEKLRVMAAKRERGEGGSRVEEGQSRAHLAATAAAAASTATVGGGSGVGGGKSRKDIEAEAAKKGAEGST